MAGEDNPNQIGVLSKRELALLIMAVSIAIVLCTYSAAIIMGMANPNTKIAVTGDIDLDLFQATVFTIVGAAILGLGISQGAKLGK